MNHNRTTLLIKIIEENPGIQFSEIMRETGMKNGVLSHHARKLEESGSIVVERTPRVTRYYPLGLNKDDLILIKNLRQETPKNILASLLEREPLTFGELTQSVKRSPSTLSLNLTQLIQDEIIESKFHNAKRTFQLKNKDLVKNNIHKYKPDVVEKAADRVGDIFSSL